MSPSDFDFFAVEVLAKPGASSPPAEVRYPILDIRPQDDSSFAFFAEVWGKMKEVLSGFHKKHGDAVPGWCNWNVVSWAKAPLLDDQQRYAAWADKTMVGFLNVRVGYPSNIDPAQPLVYIEHLATAPGNLPAPLWGRRLHEVGTALMAYAVLLSHQHGSNGRIGLHVAEPAVEGWYTNLNGRFTGRLLGHRVASGVPGPMRPNQPTAPGLTSVYLEGDGVALTELLEGYRRE